MSNPFRTFRKNQKVWIVALTLLSMFSFIFIGQWTRMGQSSGDIQNPVVFTWKYGDVHKDEIESAAYRRHFVRQFLFEIVRLSASIPLDPDRLALLNQRLGMRYSSDEGAIVNLMLLDKKAEQLGLVVSDSMINQFISLMSQDRLTNEQLAQIVQGMSSRQGSISQVEIFNALRAELAAQYVDETFTQLMGRAAGNSPRFNGDTPADRWDYFCQLNRKVTAEMMPIRVADFVSKIPDPTSKQLADFYDQYKNDEPIPGSPTPGFKRPYRAKFEYIKADNEKLMKDAQAQVTEDEIKDFYEKNKDALYKKSKLPDLPSGLFDQSTGTPGAKAGPSDQQESKAMETPAEKGADLKSGAPKADVKAGDTNPIKENDAKSTGSKSNEKKSSDAKSTDAKSSGAKKSLDSKSGASQPNDAKKSDAGKKSSLNSNDSLNGQFLALADDATPPTAKSTAPKTEAKSGASPKSDAKPATKTEAKSTTEPKTDAKSMAKSDSKTAQADSKSDETKSTDAKAPDTQAPEYKPLSEVHDRVRDQLAQKKIDEKIRSDFTVIRQLMNVYNNKRDAYRRATVDKSSSTATKPEPPTPASLAEHTDPTLDAKATDFISIAEARDTDIGRSQRAIIEGDYASPSFVEIAYALDAHSQPRLKPFQPQESYDNDDNRYLWWKVDDEPSATPPLEQIKSEVAQSWKMIQARQPALEQAKADAAEINKQQGSMNVLFTDKAAEITTAGPFSWYTRQPLSRPPLIITRVSGVDQGGDEFMQAVFALKPSEAGVAPNDPQTIYYVVQVQSEEPPVEDLRTQFMMEMSSPTATPMYAMVGYMENAKAIPQWQKELKEEFDFHLAPGQTLTDTFGWD